MLGQVTVGQAVASFRAATGARLLMRDFVEVPPMAWDAGLPTTLTLLRFVPVQPTILKRAHRCWQAQARIDALQLPHSHPRVLAEASSGRCLGLSTLLSHSSGRWAP